jgi:hypothetical protein
MAVTGIPITATPAPSFSQSQVLERARLEVGNLPSVIVGEQGVKDEAVLAALKWSVRELNALAGTNTSRKEVWFTTTAGTQDYSLAVIASDIGEVEEVYDSRAFVSDYDLGGPTETDVRGRYVEDGVVSAGYQQAAMKSIIASYRWLKLDDYHWAIAYPSGTKSLRLFPKPEGAVSVLVEYTTTAGDITTLPNEAEEALHYAACVALLDCMINRTNNERHDPEQREARMTQVKTLTAQRDRYEGKYNAAKNRLTREGWRSAASLA